MKTNSLLIFILAVSVIVLNSCGTSRFGKSHYKNRDWVWVGSESNPESSAEVTEKTDEVKTDGNTGQIIKTEKINTITQNVNNEIIPYSISEKEDSEQKISTSENESSNSKDDNDGIILQEEMNPVKNTTEEELADITKNTGSDGSWVNLLLIAVLIALAIILFTVLDSALGGILGLILLVFIILLLLRYFGVI